MTDKQANQPQPDPPAANFPTLMLTVGIDRASGQMALTSTVDADRQLEDTRMLVRGLEILLRNLNRQVARLEIEAEASAAGSE